ncbi:MAG: MFS transporter, partial [Actinomycetota bacterium]|nr:MFS transporter [Actinomycetota bacterium]
MPSSVPSAALGGSAGGDLDPASPHFSGNVLRIPVFRKMWAALGLASLGDWLSFLAFAALARELAGGGAQAANAAVAVVLIMRLAPALFLAPFAGVVADRLDRRWAMVIANAFRALVIFFVPFAENLWVLFVATLLLETASLFFIPAKEATMPNLVPRARLEAANSINLLTTYGAAAPAAVIFIVLAASKGLLGHLFGPPFGNHITLALWINGLVLLASALMIL